MSLQAAAVLFVSLALGTGVAAAQAQSEAQPGASASATPLAEDPAVTAAVKAQFLAWQAGKVEHAQYTADASRQFTPELVAQVSAQLRPLGEPTKLSLLDGRVQNGVRLYVYAIDATKGKVQVLYAVDASGKIAGIRFSPGAEDPKVTALARAQFEALAQGRIDPALYTSEMVTGMTPAALSKVRGFLTPFGAISRMTFFGKSHSGNYDTYVYKVECQHGAVRQTISLDATGKIAGLYVAPWDS